MRASLPEALTLLAEADLAAIFILDPAGRITEATPSALALLDTHLGAPLADRLIDPAGEALPPEALPHTQAQKGRVVLRDLLIRGPTGPLRIALTGAPIPDRPGFTLHLVQESAPAWQQAALAAARIGLWSWNDQTGQVSWSDQAFHLTEQPLDRTPPSFASYLERVHPDDHKELRQLVAQAAVTPDTHATHAHRLCLPDGSVRWVAWTGAYYRDPRDPSIRMVGAVQDITPRKLAEQDVRALQSRLSLLLRYTPGLALQGYDRDGRIIFWNPASEHLFGWSEAEALGRTLDELIYTEEQAAAFLKALRQVKYGSAPAPTEHAFRAKDGRTGWCLSTLFQISGPDEPLVIICMDVDQTESRALRDRIAQAKRLESLGRLAGGVAHDFNNLLTSILGFSDLAADATERSEPDEALRHLGHVRSAAGRGAALTQQLLAYARQQIIEPRPVDVNQLLLGMAGLLPTMLGDEVKLRVQTAPQLPPVLLDPIQFDQIVLNLALNGADAMPDGGTLTLKTELHRDEQGVRWIRLTVNDTGSGIPDAYQPLVFDPFFTTKAEGRGTGLGLATCYGIVHQSNGRIGFHSAPGQGTRFYVDLPAEGDAPEPAPGLDPRGAPP